ncbi:elongin C [Coemansia sp. RSA 1939]|nr:elongin C [Coemansia sp. RSA 1939]KAJ2595831.1 elongin C [Coemansia sp. RSA 1804]
MADARRNQQQPNNEPGTVKLTSGDGFSFIVPKGVAEHSPTIRNMLQVSRGSSSDAAGFTEALTNEIRFPEIKGGVLEKVCQYLIYKHRYVNSPAAESVPEFKFDLELVLEVLTAADYLDC